MTILISKALLPNSQKRPLVLHLTGTWDTLIQTRKLGKYSKIITSSVTGRSYHWKNKLILLLGLVWRRKKKKKIILDFPQTDRPLLSKHPMCFHSITQWPRHSWCLSHLCSLALTATSTAWSRQRIEGIIRRFPHHQTRIARWQGEVPPNHVTPTHQYLDISYCWQSPQSRLVPFLWRPACLMVSVQVWILGTFLPLTHTHTHTHTRFQVYQRGP